MYHDNNYTSNGSVEVLPNLFGTTTPDLDNLSPGLTFKIIINIPTPLSFEVLAKVVQLHKLA